jgi:hypothetical protein
MPRTAAFRGGCPAAEAGAWPTHRAAELVQHGWVHTGLSPTSRRPPAAVLHPGHECSRAPWPTRAALGAPWCGPCGEGGDARVVDASDLRSVAMYGPKARAATVAESSSTLVGPQQRARAHHEEQPGDAASSGEGGVNHPTALLLVDAPCDRRGIPGCGCNGPYGRPALARRARRARAVRAWGAGCGTSPPPGAPHGTRCGAAHGRAGRNAGSSWAWVIAMGHTAHPHPPGPRLALVPYVPVGWAEARDPPLRTVRRVQGCSERLHMCAPCSARDPRGRGRWPCTPCSSHPCSACTTGTCRVRRGLRGALVRRTARHGGARPSRRWSPCAP